MSQPETVQEAAGKAAARWRNITIGLAIVGASSFTNTAINAYRIAKRPLDKPVPCYLVPSPEQAADERFDDQGGRLAVPQPAGFRAALAYVDKR